MVTNGRPYLVLSTSKKEGMFKSVPCYLVFLENEIVFAHLSKERQKQEMKEYKERLKAEGKGFFKSTMAIMNFWVSYGERYYEMTIESILNEESKNYKIRNGEINKFTFKSTRSDHTTESGGDKQGEIIIQTNAGKTKFFHKYRDPNKKIKEILNNLYGNRLKYKGGGGFTINIGGNKNGIS